MHRVAGLCHRVARTRGCHASYASANPLFLALLPANPHKHGACRHAPRTCTNFRQDCSLFRAAFHLTFESHSPYHFTTPIMKLILAAATFVTTANAFGSSSPRLAGGNRLFSTALNAGNVGLYYSTSTGNTETVAGYIADASGLRADDIGDASDADIQAHDAIIVGGKVTIVVEFCCVDLLLYRLLIQTNYFFFFSQHQPGTPAKTPSAREPLGTHGFTAPSPTST